VIGLHLPAALLVALAAAGVRADDGATVRSVAAEAGFGFERVRLPGGEGLGLANTRYVVELAPGWWLGPSLYGAASGHRGGLFTWGVEGQRRWALADRWQLVGGLYVGGGGGASAPVGGGLMLRPHADLMFDLGGWSAGVGVSQVRFPSGSIGSTQAGLVLSVGDRISFTDPGRHGATLAFEGVDGLRADRVAAAVGRYAHTSAGGPAMAYAGLRAERALAGGMAVDLEGAGAAQGGADGYAEFGAGLSAMWPADGEPVRAGVRAMLGLAGGGAVATGGGPIAKLALAGRLQLSPQWSIDLEAGRARAFSGGFSTPYGQVSLATTLGRRAAGGDVVHDGEWAVASQVYSAAKRRDGSTRGLGALGLKFSRVLDGGVYAGVQAWGAVTGGAGAFSVGLIGLGVAAAPLDGWRIGAEMMVGAAGGGGVSSHGGAVAQPLVWAGSDLGRLARLKLGAGYIKSLRGELASPLVDLTFAIAFGTP